MRSYLPENGVLRFVSVIFLAMIGTFFLYYHTGLKFPISWELITTAENTKEVVYGFQQGPFTFQVEGQVYKLQERFTASDITIPVRLATILTIVSWIAVCGLIALATNLKRYWFIGFGILVILFANSLDLDALGVLGSRSGSKVITGVFILVLLGPAYYFHAYKPEVTFYKKWLIVGLSGFGFLAILYTQSALVVPHVIAYSTFGMGVAFLLFLFLIAEEIIFSILFFITKNRGGRHNEKHFLIFSTAYLLFVGLYYAKKAALISLDMRFFDPFHLLLISSLVALWSVQYKQELINSLFDRFTDIRWILVLLGLIGIGFGVLAFAYGNDPVIDTYHHVILYAHLGFGFLFILYVGVNFIDPLVQGLQVYKVVYKERPFPYSTARLAGFVAFLAFFFLSDQIAYKYLQGARFNYLGSYHQFKNEVPLAMEYYRQAGVFAWDNHFANYHLGRYYEKKNDLNEYAYRYKRATTKNPSPYAYVMAANALDDNPTRAVSILYEGLTDFPKSGEIANNLAVNLISLGNDTEASRALEAAGPTDDWNDAVNVNRTTISDQKFDEAAFIKLKLPVKANYLYQLINSGQFDQNLTVDTADFSVRNLHSMAFLINANYILTDSLLSDYSQRYLGALMSTEMATTMRFSHAMQLYRSGNVNASFQLFDQIQANANRYEKGLIFNTMGKLAMEQHAPKLAIDYFDRAISCANEEAKLNRAIASLETGDWAISSVIWSQLVAGDSAYLGVFESILPILTAENNDSFAYYYYRFGDLSADEQTDVLSKLEESQRLIIWKKLKNQTVSTYGLLGLDSLRNAWTQYRIAETQIATGSATNGFDESAVLMFANDTTRSLEVRYNALLEATEINPYAISLQKAYCFIAVEMGLEDYAETALMRLYELLPPAEFGKFEREYYQSVQAFRQKMAGWE